MMQAIQISVMMVFLMSSIRAQDTLWINGTTLLSLQFPGQISGAMLPADYAHIEDSTQEGLLVIGTTIDSPRVGKLMVRYESSQGPRVYGAVLAPKEQVQQFVFNIGLEEHFEKDPPQPGAMNITEYSYTPTPDTLLSSQIEKLKGLKRRINSVGVYENKVEVLLENLAVDDQWIYFKLSLENLSKYKVQTDTLRIASLVKGKRWGANQQNRMQLLPLYHELPGELEPKDKKEIYFVSLIPPVEDKSYLEFSLKLSGRKTLEFELSEKLLQNPQRL